MIRRLQEETALFPEPHQGTHYWHLHLPVPHAFIDSQTTPKAVQRLCAQMLIDCAYHLTQIASPSPQTIRIVAAITLPEMWPSQLIVFFDSDYFDKFFDRNTDHQRWSLLEKSLIKQWHLSLPDGFSERAYHEERLEEDATYKSTLWFIGQLAP